MKLMKKLTALLLTLVMILGMGSVVHASETTTGTGKITINNAISGQTYRIYRILELESYTEGGNYAYKATDAWKEFFANGEGKNYLTIDGSGVVTSSTELTTENAAAFAKAALAYAKENNIENNGKADATGTPVTFDRLPLGYYLVDSSTGALCSLKTTTGAVEILEKNGVPSVTKTVDNVNANTANIGQTVTFTTTITAQPGAEKYVLHDQMSQGLTFDDTTVNVKKGETTLGATEYTLKKDELADTCTFEIVFAQSFCNTLTAEDTITVTYTAKLNEKAVIAGAGNTNTTKLSYGDNRNTNVATTTTKTFELPVYKFTKGTTNSQTALPGVKFTLRENENGTDPIKLVKIRDAAADDLNSADVYRHAKDGETTGIFTEVTTPATGRFTIQGLKAGTYYLTETDTVRGYNKLTAPVTVVIDENGKVTVGGTEKQTVEIENKTGSLLPSTGGRGTMAFYIVGALLVLGSGVVLITKKRMR